MKKSCLISFIGLSRTFEQCSENILKNIINFNSDYFDFFIDINTELGNKLTKKWTNVENTILEKSYFEDKIISIYGNLINNITYLNIDNINEKSGTQIFRERCKFIFELENHKIFDLYIFIRFDVILNKPIDLKDFLPKNKFKLSFITGGSYNINRLDHCYDWDYCWIGDKFSIDKWLTYYSPKSVTKENVISASIEVEGFRGTYIKKILNGSDLEDHWVNNYWKIFYNLLELGCEISFDKEKDNVFLKIIR